MSVREVTGRAGGGRRRPLSHQSIGLLRSIADFQVRYQRMPLMAEVVDISMQSIDRLRALLQRSAVCVIDGHRIRVTRTGWAILRSNRA